MVAFGEMVSTMVRHPVAAELTFERLVDDNFMVIIPLPFDGRLGAAFRLAAQSDIVALAHNDITGGQRIVNVRWHCKRKRERERGMKGVGYYYSCRLNINSKQVAPAAELDLNAKTFAFWQRLERHESGNSHSTD